MPEQEVQIEWTREEAIKYTLQQYNIRGRYALEKRTITVWNPDLQYKTWGIYFDAVKFPGFPRNKCVPVAIALEGLGFQRIPGFFKVDELMRPGSKYRYLIEPHSWAEDAKGTIIDLTLHQFNQGLDIPQPAGVRVINQGHPLYSRYIKPGIEDIDKYLADR